MDTTAIIFLVCTLVLLSCIFALNIAYEAQERNNREMLRKMVSDVRKIEAAMEDARRVEK